MYDIIIVGAGPAGLTAALYALRANRKVLVLEAKSYGGQILNASIVENYPGIPSITGFDYATALYNQVLDLDGEIKFETVLKVSEDKVVTTSENTYTAKSVILATGSENRKLRIDREGEFLGHGLSYCATCDGNFFKGKTVAVIGGGNTALEDALYLSDIVEKVYVIHRRDEFRGEKAYQRKLEKRGNVEFIFNSNLTKLIGRKNLKAIEITDNDGKVSRLDVEGVFIAVGQEPKNEIFADVVDLDQNGYIIAIDDVHTKTEGIYVAGDARVKSLRQLTTAVSDGSVAATTAIKEMKRED